jgi:hypothetical protein
MSAMLKIASFVVGTFIFPLEPNSGIPACVRIRRNLDRRAMYRFLFLLLVVPFSLLTSCGGNDRVASGAGAETAADTVAAIPTDTRRQVLILELKRLKHVFHSGDKNKVADLFTFPAADTVLQVYVDDPAFAQKLSANKDELSREIFLEFFPQISQSIMLPEMDTLFRVLNPDSLAFRDTLAWQQPVKSEPCYKYYSMTIEGDLLVLVTGIDSNKEYVNPDTGATEPQSEMCESAIVWVFRFDGRKLVLKQQSAAG